MSIHRLLNQGKVGLVILSITLLFTCAHKAPPIAKDRLAPRLKRVTPLNSRQVQFTFTEEIDTLSLVPENFLILSGTDTLPVITLHPSLSKTEIVAITAPQEKITYNVSGIIYDLAENRGSFSTQFIGSTIPDTIPAWPVKYYQGKGFKEFMVQFSKAMDTTSLNFYIIPKKNLHPEWLNLRTVRFTPDSIIDTLGYDTTYYLYIKEVKDISQNRTENIITSITPDTVYNPLVLKGEVRINDTLLKKGIAIIKLIVAGDYSGQDEVAVGRANVVRLKPGRVDIDSLLN
ncbi:hypothetical protein BXT86_05700 [candidate division WOR-3 bacterium 4484_100]|uniref:SbsA Ig-like domain-containing protein n=1 Tax=candidate division WOR-3 bacterium 4484_100 TaxID=1936077 RepID=A0A1V4QE03_UNCW3|nr:MAG: hypothetical protein BXT86_05700 [candidate division WOR-3 bacterium 4484_100]